ncbi:MAG: PAS domain S-box protein [Nitrospiraceae bacterium]|nr:MAG: PAS domain S-box protein [Nitrospiraceae bacterium]
MTVKKTKNSAKKNRGTVDLRRKAEERLKARDSGLKHATDADLRGLVHELHVHQTELEMQNEELRRIQKELEESRNKYSDLYDLAPVGYLTLDETGLILEANITAAGQLGTVRSLLINKPFYHYIKKESRDILYLHLREVFKSIKFRMCEISVRGEEHVFEARLDSVLVKNSGGNYACRTSIIDVTEKRLAEGKVKQAAEEWEKTFNSVDYLISIHDRKNKLLRVNKPFADFFRIKEKDIAGKTCHEVVHKTEKPWAGCPCPQAVRLKQPVNIEFFNPHAGSYFEVSAIPMFNDNNEVVSTVHIMKDITGQKRAEKILKEERDRSRHYLDIAGVMIVAIDAGQKVTLVNKKGCEILEGAQEDIIGRNWFKAFIPRRMRSEMKAVFAKLTAGELSPVEYFENPVVTLKGRERLISWHNYLLRNEAGEISGTLSSGEDITERRQAEEELKIYRDHLEQLVKNRTDELAKTNMSLRHEIKNRKRVEDNLRESHKQLQDLTAYLESVREKERSRIARDIHDELGQSLTALKMELSWLKKRLQKGQGALSKKAESMFKLIAATVKTVQRISSELRPGLLDDLGLAAAIEWQAGEFQKRTGIKCEVRIIPEDLILDKELATNIFRIFQQAITNVLRHAGATRIRVSLKADPSNIELAIRDNGKGISQEQISSPYSFGLISMRERVLPWAGRVKIRGAENKGTTIKVKVPVNPERRQAC